jgi:hypothetical protein
MLFLREPTTFAKNAEIGILVHKNVTSVLLPIFISCNLFIAGLNREEDMQERKPNTTLIVALSLLIAISSSCDTDEEPVLVDDGTSPQEQPTYSPPPEDEGSAVLFYKQVSDDPPNFVSTAQTNIPLFIFIDKDTPKEPALLAGSIVDDYHVQVAGQDQGQYCFLNFTLKIEYDVNGLFYPEPQCVFDVSITTKVKTDQIERMGNCSVPLHESYPAETLHIWPPAGPHRIPGSLLPLTLRKDAQTEITIQLKDVIVPLATDCQF